MDQSARQPQAAARPGREFFLNPSDPTHRRYEALRAYLAEGQSASADLPATITVPWWGGRQLRYQYT